MAEKFVPLHHGQSEGGKFSYRDVRAFNCLSKYHTEAKCALCCVHSLQQWHKEADNKESRSRGDTFALSSS